MKVIILAAGFGTRLGKFSENIPKGLITDQNNNSLLGKLLSDLQTIPNFNNSEGATIITNARDYDKYANYLKENNLDISLINNNILTVETSLGALNDLLFAIEQKNWQAEDILVLPSDTYYEFKLTDFIIFAKSKNSLITVVNDIQNKNLIKNRLGCAVLDNDKIISFEEKPNEPKSSLAAIPFYYYPTEFLINLKNYLAEIRTSSSPGDIIPWLLQKNITIYAYVATGKYLDVGTVKELEKLKQIS
ncbi:MAG: sugar phosphate nucleotidyltransferase [Patescibacteria group bacterium]